MNTNQDRKWIFISLGSVGIFALLIIAILLFNSHPGTAADEANTNFVLKPEMQILQELNKAYVELAKISIPSVVKIKSEVTPKKTKTDLRQRKGDNNPFDPFNFFDDPFKFFDEQQTPRPSKGWGSGFIIDKEGHILTNNHVVAGADKITVTLDDKREFEAKVIGNDQDTDIAVIKVEQDNLPVAKLGDSDKVQAGEIVMAVGSPFELTRSITTGVVSATGRSNVGIPGLTYEDFIQTDAAINPGNSGGPLINIRGEVIGINTAIATGGLSGGNVGIGFAVPINTARNIMEQLLSGKKIVRGWLGVVLQPVDSDIAEKYGLKEKKGALILSVDGPAKDAGLKQGDLIIEYDGKVVSDSAHLSKMVAASKPDDKVKIKVIRDGKEKEFNVKLAERTKDAISKLRGSDEGNTSDSSEEWMGMSAQELDDSLAQRMGYENQKGVIITDVDPSGPAMQVDNPPQRGDLIQEIEGMEIMNMSDYRKAIEKVKDEKKVMVRLRRASSNPWYVVLKKQ
ncbi:MAG: serine protease Do [Candidatus Poribacteria bacterium]|nr:serine protease Do [Candidatus Poribacteria bacterium]